MSVDWSETKTILLEVEQLFNRDDDIRDIIDVKKMQEEIDMHSSNHLRDAKELIREMTNRVVAKESEIIAPTEAQHMAELERIVAEKENTNSQIESLRNIIDKRRESNFQMAKMSLNLKEKTTELAQQQAMQQSDSPMIYMLSLYGKLSGISWDYATPPNRLSGTIKNDATNELRTFEIDTRAKTSYETANTLWDLIAETFEESSV